MKKHVFLNVPEQISREDLEKLRSHYKNQGFIVYDPVMLAQYMHDYFYIKHGVPFSRAKLLGYSLEHLSMCDAVIQAPRWENDEACNLVLRFAQTIDIPIWEQYSIRRMNYDSIITIRIGKRENDERILDSEKEAITEPEVGNP